MEATVREKWTSNRPVEMMEDQIKISKASRGLSFYSLSPSIIIHHSASPETSLFLSISCPNIFSYKPVSKINSKRSYPNISTSYSALDLSPKDSCSSSPTAAFITAPDTTPAGSISSWGSCCSG